MSNVMNSTDRFGFLKLRCERRDDRHVIALTGELDLDGVQRVTEALELAEASDARQIVLDLAELDFIDSSGVQLILTAHLRSHEDGHRLVLTPGPAQVQRVFELSGVAERLPFEA